MKVCTRGLIVALLVLTCASCRQIAGYGVAGDGGLNDAPGDVTSGEGTIGGALLWRRIIASDEGDDALGISISAQGRVAVAGQCGDECKVDNGSPWSGHGDLDGMVAVFDGQGGLDGGFLFGGGEDDVAQGILLDGTDVFVVGQVRDEADFGKPASSITITAKSQLGDAFFAKLKDDGAFVAVSQLGVLDSSISDGDASAYALARDGLDTLIVGDFHGIVSVPQGGTREANGQAGFVWRVDQGGATKQLSVFGAKKTGPAADVRLRGVAASPTTSMAWVVGTLKGDVTWPQGPLKAKAVDALVLEYAASGSLASAHHIGGNQDDEASAVAFGPAGGLLVAGYFLGTVPLGAGDIVAVGNKADIFVADWSTTGPTQIKRYGDLAAEEAFSIAADGQGFALCGMVDSGIADFGDGTVALAGGAGDAFVAVYNGAGKLRWARVFGGAQRDRAEAIALDATKVCVAGSFAGDFSVDGQQFSSQGAGEFPPLNDAFVACFAR
jgi:hypothetical protein